MTRADQAGMRIACDVNKDGWEKADFPILCETCMGNNPYVRMMKEDFGRECFICQRPHTIFKWKPGGTNRYKSTVVCQTCARMKNVCQTCLFDLEFGLPVAVRDKFMEEHDKIEMPLSRANQRYVHDQMQKKVDNNELPYGKQAEPSAMLKKLARMTPYYKRNEARICSFYVKGECNRGNECPYRHEMPVQDELSKQKMRDRFHGEDDPVANKIFRTMDEKFTLKTPEDRTITSLYLGGLIPEITDSDIRQTFYVYGEILSIKLIQKSHCAFVHFATREAAEQAADKLYRCCDIKGKRIHLDWAKPDTKSKEAQQAALSAEEVPELPGKSKMPPMPMLGSFGAFTPYYPSMDPMAQGNAPLEAGDAPLEGGGPPRVMAGAASKKRARG